MIYTVAAGIVVVVLIWVAWTEIRGQRKWVVSRHTYEGFPLLLRRLERLPFPSRRQELPTLATITHTFSKRLPNGLPETDYNASLLEMDLRLVDAMNDESIGLPVLVETFGGKRMYYYYVVDQRSAEKRFEDIRPLFPAEELSFESKADPDWGFMQRYAKDFFPDLPF
jgi:hypothetical protein